MSGSAGHQTVRLSNIGTLEDVIAFNKDGTLKERKDTLITQLSSTAGVNGLSDNQKAKRKYQKNRLEISYWNLKLKLITIMK